jgi:hypothetical protein
MQVFQNCSQINGGKFVFEAIELHISFHTALPQNLQVSSNTLNVLYSEHGITQSFAIGSSFSRSPLCHNILSLTSRRGFGLGTTEFCVIIPWAGCAVLIANALNSHASWRWVYYLCIIYSVIALAGTTAFYFPPSRPQHDFDKTRWQEIKELDYIGVILYTSGLTVFVLGLTWAGATAYPWSSASVIAPIVLGVCTLAACFAYDFILAKRPFFPARLFSKLREFTVLLVVVFVSGMCYYSMAALLPQGALYMYTQNPIEIGVISLPGGLGQVLGGFILPSLAHRIKHIKTQIIIALEIQTLFIGIYSSIPWRFRIIALHGWPSSSSAIAAFR